jgi:hypothetical protein
VTEYGDIESFKKEEPIKFETWKRMAEKRYADTGMSLNELYLEKACFLAEFSKIVAITYATVKTNENGKLTRKIESIEGETEINIINEFCSLLDASYSVTHQSHELPYNLCGHNIIGHDIPLLTKRIIKYRKEFGDKLHKIPQLLKHYLSAKPWDTNVIDTINVWKFNGTDFISLNLVADHMGLKKSVQLLSKEDINKIYWSGIEDDSGSTMKEIVLQSINYTNVAFQLVKELGEL